MTRTAFTDLSLRLLAATCLLASTEPALAQESTGALRDWIGVWRTVDTYHPPNGSPTVEEGVRTCELVMREAYLQCDTVVERDGTVRRVYRFLLNYNRTTQRFEMLSLWSNVPHKLVQQLTPDAQRRRWTFSNLAVIGDDEPMALHWSELVFESRDRIVWTGRRITAATTDPSTAPLSFQETWTRLR